MVLTGFEVRDRIVAAAGGIKDKGVSVTTTRQRVITCTAFQRVLAITAYQRVIACIAL